MARRMRASWPKRRRLRSRREFLAVQARGRKVHGRHFVALVGAGPCTWGRLGITVSKRVGNAVVRNRIRRRVREFVRQQPAGSWLPAGRDVVVIAKRSARAADAAEIAVDLARVGARL